jgi:hypothetical protein
MDFKKYLEMINEEDAYDKDVKSSDKPHDKEAANARAKKAAVAARNKAKTLKDWFEIVDKKMIAEADQLTIEPAKQSTQVIKKGNDVIGSVTNPALAATIKSAIGKGEMSLAGDELNELSPNTIKSAAAKRDAQKPGQMSQATQRKDIATHLTNRINMNKKLGEEGLDEKWAGDAEVKPTGQYAGKSVEELKSMLAKLKKSGPHKEGTPGFKRMRQIMFAIRAKKDWKGGVDEGEQVAEKAVSKAQQKFMGMVHAAQKGEKPMSKAVADVAKSMKKGDVKDFAQTKHKGLPEKKKKADEAEIPKSGTDYGAGLGAGRNPKVLESKQVNEAMNTLEAAYHEGKSHGLSKHNYACRYNEGSDEHRRYHEGFKEGIDECYGLMPNRGLVVSEIESGQDVVDDMAGYGAEEGSLGEMDKTAYMKQQAIKTPGSTFKAFGQTMHDKDVLETDAFAFESLDNQLNALLTEGEEAVAEGLSVNMSQGLNGGVGDDSVSVSATGDDAGKLLAFIKQVGLGGLGGDKQLDGPAEPAMAVSDYGAPKFSGYDDKGGMMGLLKVMSGGDDYKDEEGHDHSGEESTCNECGGMMEAGHSCGSKEMVDEVESEDQMEYQVAEDDGEGYEQGQEAAAQIDSALAASGADKGGATNEDGMESNPLAADAVASADAAEEEEEAVSESRSSFLNLYKKLAWLAEESTAEKDDKAEKAAKKVAKDIEYDEGHKGKDDDKAEKAGQKVKKDIEYDDKKDKKEKVDEWANDAGKDGTQQTFERDIEFMTKVISGGLNKPKSTGQQTIPVLAGDKERTGDEDMSEYKRLAGLSQ